MLQLNGGTISESVGGGGSGTTVYYDTAQLSNCIQTTPAIYQYPFYGYWGNYPVYVCTDKTKKAIDVLKALEADKAIKLTSVKSFIAMVEKIASLL